MTTVPPPGYDRHAKRMGRVDGCPECVDNVTAPVEVRDDLRRTDGRSGFIATYECEDCRVRWTTGWEG